MIRVPLVVGLTCCAAIAQARVIDSFHYAPVSALTTVSTPATNNDNAGNGNLNAVMLPNNGQGTSAFLASSPSTFDFVFNVHASGGTTEYAFSSELYNSGPSPWLGYKIQIGRGIGASFQLGGVAIPEVQIPDFDSPQFDPAPTSNFFSSVSVSPYEISWSNGSVPVTPFTPNSSTLARFTFSIDVPDDIGLDSYSNFTLRQITVPEPSTLTLAALCTIGLLLVRHWLWPDRPALPKF